MYLQGEMNINGTSIGCSQSPGRAFMGVLPTLFHDVSGELFVRDNKSVTSTTMVLDQMHLSTGILWAKSQMSLEMVRSYLLVILMLGKLYWLYCIVC